MSGRAPSWRMRGLLAAALAVGLALFAAPGALAGATHPVSSSGFSAFAGAARSGVPGGVTILDNRHLQITLSTGRDYVLQVPPTHTTSWPLVIGLHGWRNSWHNIAHDANLDAHADANNYIVAYGIGIDSSWNGGGCCGTAAAENIDDVSYLVAIAQDIELRYVGLVDPARVYLMGFSAGHMLAYRAECERPDFFAGIGGAGGTLYGTCTSTEARPFHSVHVHGGFDTTVPWRGGYSGYLRMDVPAGATIGQRISGPGSELIAILAPKCGHGWPSLDRCGFDATDAIWHYLANWHR